MVLVSFPGNGTKHDDDEETNADIYSHRSRSLPKYDNPLPIRCMVVLIRLVRFVNT